MLKRILSIALCVLMLAGTLTLFSCGNSDEIEQPTDTVSTFTPNNNNEVVDTSATFDVPDSLDYGGKEIVIMGYDWTNDEFGVMEKEKKGIIDEALVTRDNFLRNYLGIELKIIQESGQWQAVNDGKYTTPIENSIKNGESAYDIICCYSLAAPLMAANGYMLNMNVDSFTTRSGSVTNHLDFDKVWWPDYMINTVKINDKVYFASGDASANLLFNLQAVLFDSTQLRNNQLDENAIYEMVDNGEWTVESLFTMTMGLSENRGDEVWDDNDYYAISTSSGTVLDSFYFATGNRIIENQNNVLVISDDILEEKILDIYSMVYSAVYTDHTMRNPKTSAQLLKSGNCIFNITTLNEIRTLTTETDAEIGLLPFPKYDVDDKDYPEMSSAIIETIAYSNYEMVTPVIFETAMKLRYSKDTNTSRMFDVARAGATTDLGVLHYFTFFATGPDPQSMFRNAILTANTAWTSNYRNKYESSMKNTLNQLNSFYLH